jgi:hypothetical protein
MYDMLLVKIIDSGNQLSKELLGVSLLEIPTSENVVKQLPAWLSAFSLRNSR